MSTARVRSRAPGFRSSKRGQSNRKRGKTVRKKELYRHPRHTEKLSTTCQFGSGEEHLEEE